MPTTSPDTCDALPIGPSNPVMQRKSQPIMVITAFWSMPK